MTGKTNPIPMFVVIYPYKFTDFLYDLIEIEYFKPYCEVAIWDISHVIDRKFAEGISATGFSKKELVLVVSIGQFFSLLMNLRKTAKQRKVCVLNEVTMDNMSSILCSLMINFLIKNTGAAILDLYNGGIPIFTGEATSSGRRDHFFRRCLTFAKRTKSLSEALKTLKSISCQVLGRICNISPTTHRLVAGDDWIEVAKRHGTEKRRIRLIYGSSNDFSNNLHGKAENINAHRGNKKTAVLLDGAGPMFTSDASYMRRKEYITTDVWYPALTRFFNWLEAETGARIEIAGHYKSTHPAIAPCFGNRSVHYGKTRELVYNSEFVIARASTAISYAVIFKKPVIFIYSNQLKEDHLAMRGIRGMAAMLGNEPVNIDEPPIDIGCLLKIDEERYWNYEKVCLTSASPQRSNVQIILEDIMNINTGSDFTKTSPNRMIK